MQHTTRVSFLRQVAKRLAMSKWRNRSNKVRVSMIAWSITPVSEWTIEHKLGLIKDVSGVADVDNCENKLNLTSPADFAVVFYITVQSSFLHS